MKDYINTLNIRFNEGKKFREKMPYLPEFVKKKNSNPGTDNKNELHRTTGSSLFVTKVIPDVKYITNWLCRYNSQYDDDFIEIGKRII